MIDPVKEPIEYKEGDIVQFTPIAEKAFGISGKTEIIGKGTSNNSYKLKNHDKEYHTDWFTLINLEENNKKDKEDLGKHYRFSFKGIKIDVYRILEIFQITNPAQQHAIKKLLRAGKSIKSFSQDIDEVILTLERLKEMIIENE